MEITICGTAQDGGIPHFGCTCPRCQRARADPDAVRYPASLLVDEGTSVLIDASMDIRQQIVGDVDSVVLTHAHLGHLPGILQFGREALDADSTPVYCSERLAAYIRTNEPFAALVANENISLRPVASGSTIELATGSIQPFAVPHRDESETGTFGLELRGSRTLVYIPDIDVWDDRSLARIERADVAILDGTFWDPDELGRQTDVPHPPIRDALDTIPVAETDVYFTHMNHTNPVLDDHSAERCELTAAGAGLVERGDVFILS